MMQGASHGGAVQDARHNRAPHQTSSTPPAAPGTPTRAHPRPSLLRLAPTPRPAAAAHHSPPIPFVRAQGLRLHDNPALLAACEGAQRVYPIFIIDPHFLQASSYK